MALRLLLLVLLGLLPSLLPACTGARKPAGGGVQAPDTLSMEGRLRSSLEVLAADSLEGRGTGTRGSALAADFIALTLERYGLEGAFGGSFLQAVPMARVRGEGGRIRLVLGGGPAPGEVEGTEGWEVLEEVHDVNVGAVFRGSDPSLAHEVVIVGAHFDHLGTGTPPVGGPAEAEGDFIYNGADDDATGVAAVLEVARAFAREGPGARTVLFLLSTGEEVGMLGTRWYLRHPALPLEATVADLQVEMIGRPDSLAGGPGRAWLTGFERSTLGPMLSAEGIPLVADPRPEEGYFFRSDNLPFALAGIPAHTVSSFNLHPEYHTPDDEVDRLDLPHMARVVEALVRAVRILASGEVPGWSEGGRPEIPLNGR